MLAGVKVLGVKVLAGVKVLGVKVLAGVKVLGVKVQHGRGMVHGMCHCLNAWRQLTVQHVPAHTARCVHVQLKRYAIQQDAYDGYVGHDTHHKHARTHAATTENDVPPHVPSEKKVNAGCGSLVQRRAFVDMANDAILRFKELTATVNKRPAGSAFVSKVSLARQALADVSNDAATPAAPTTTRTPTLSPKVLMRRAYRTPRTDEMRDDAADAASLPAMGRPPILPPLVSEAFVQHALSAADTDGAHNKSSLASDMTEFFNESIEGRHILQRFKCGEVSRRVVQSMVEKHPDAEFDTVEALDPNRADAYFYANFDEHYSNFSKRVIEQGLGANNPRFDPKVPLSEPVYINKPGHIVTTDEVAMNCGEQVSGRTVDKRY